LNYSQLFERAIVGVFQSSVEGRYLCVNPAFATMLGYESPEDLIASITDIGTQIYVSSDQRATVLTGLIEQNTMLDFECECLRKDGTRIWVRQDAYVVRDESGQPLYFEGFVHDITERRKADEALRLARFTVDHATVQVFWIRSDATLADVNHTACRTLGYSREELLSLRVDDIDLDHPLEDWDSHWADLRRDGVRTFPSRQRRKDGSVLNVEITAHLLNFGGQELNCAFVRDVTEQRRASEERDRLWNHSIDPMCIAGFDGYFKQINPAWITMLGWTDAELLGSPWLDFVHPDDYQATVETGQTLVSGAPVHAFENRYRCRDGSYRWLSWTVFPLPESQEMFAVARDVTHQKKLSADLQRVLDLTPDLICCVRDDGFCHQVNSAFTSTLGWSEDELLSRSVIEFVHADDRDKAIQTLSEIFHGVQLVDYEVRLLCKDGTHRWIEWRTATKIDDGLLFAIGRDVTNSRHEFELMREVEATANVGGWELNFVTGQLFWSRQTYLIHELSPDCPTPSVEEAIAYYAPDARLDIKEAIQSGMTDGVGWNLELPLITAKGRHIWVVAQGKVEVSNGVPIRAFGSFQDITARKQAETKLKQSKASLRAFLNALQEPAFLMDNQGIVLVSNDSLANRVGTTIREVVGKRIFDFLPPPVARLRMNMLERVLQTRKSIQFEDSNQGRYFINYASPVQEASGEVSRVAILAVDITDRIKAEEGLRLFRALVDQTTDGIEVIDPATGQFLDVNEKACTAHGYTREEYLSLKVPDVDPLIPPESWNEIIQGKRQTNQLTFESQHRRKDGTIFPVEVKLNFVQVDREYLVAGVRDITERKHLEDQLRQSQKLQAIGRLAGGVAHDFNNLLTVIIGHAECLLPDVSGRPFLRDSVLEILGAAERAATLTAQLLAFSRKALIEPKILNLNQLVKTVIRMLTRLIGEDIRVVTSLDPRISSVKIDPGQAEQVLINLAVNARDAMPDGGVLTFATRTVAVPSESTRDLNECLSGSYVELTVSDTGKGMTVDVMQQIFEPFFTTKEIGKGTGLGLSTVYGIVAQASGTISVESEVGVGSTFRIILPAVEGAEVSPMKGIHPARSGTETILLAEDDKYVRQLAQLTLEAHGYQVLHADSGDAALQLAANHDGPIDLMVTDVVMPDFGGRELVEKLRAIRPGIAILYMSGYTDDAVIRHGIEAATDAFLQKPFTPQSLAQKVREALEGSNSTN
jgi:two-component system cell cycle sensor histidine kinase/response regulator CckA